MRSPDGNLYIVFNGEIYNFLELRNELKADFEFKTQSDTEVLLAAYQKWGEDCLDRFIGMFAFVIWNKDRRTAFAARDRFGVKPFYYHRKSDGTLLIASEIKSIHSAGIAKEPNGITWATYLASGLYNHSEETFWKDVYSLPAGHKLNWKNNKTEIACWYDIAEKVGDEFDRRPEAEVAEEYFELMKDSVKLRFRSDVAIGINLSGGLDSSSLLGLVHAVQGDESNVKAFTFTTGDENYDELPWVRQMLEKTNHSLIVCELTARDVPTLAADVQYYQDEPFGGIPTLAYARLFEKAREHETIVLLDGNGMDEQWAGYDYYRSVASGQNGNGAGLVQGTSEKPFKPECLMPEFRALADGKIFSDVFSDRLRNLQYRDAKFTKIPRAMRFNDRVSMRSSTELREPFLDHRLFELAMRQPADRKINGAGGKKMLRRIARRMMPDALSAAPKRPMQTPQREWLRGDLRDWAEAQINLSLKAFSGEWLNEKSVRRVWEQYCRGESDNSFYVWQWISLSLMTNSSKTQTRVYDLGK